jgi:hypothetical protein
MKHAHRARLARWGTALLLSAALVEACSSSSATTAIASNNGPSNVEIVTPVDAVGCDDTLVVHLSLTNFKPRPPAYCGTLPQCGSVLVTLLETDGGPPLLSQRAATSDVQLDLTDLFTPKTADGPTLSQVHFIRVDLYDDKLAPYDPGADGVSSNQVAVSLSAPGACAGAGGAAGATAGEAGAAGALAGQGGANTGGSGGASGSGAGGSGGMVAVGAAGESNAGAPALP